MTDFRWIDKTIEALCVERYGQRHVPTYADLARLEARLGHELPAAYRFFLIRYGGCAFGGDEDHVAVAGSRFSRSPDYEGMYAISATFAEFLRAMHDYWHGQMRCCHCGSTN